MAAPTIYPTGATVYDPDKCWNGYTLYIARETGAALVNMNGRVVNRWSGFQGFPNKMLPGGHVMRSLGVRDPKYGYMDQTDVARLDWDGNVVWKFDQYEFIEDPDNIIWDGRQTNIIAIIDKQTGKLVWQVGPDCSLTPELRKLGWIIGQHHAHMIPRGLPGEGNILVFDTCRSCVWWIRMIRDCPSINGQFAPSLCCAKN